MFNQKQLPQAVQSCHDLIGWLIPQLDKFPRSRKFTLGERIESGLIEILELLIDASYSKQKQVSLNTANRRLASCRHLWRLSLELHVIPMKRYQYGSGLIEGLAAQIGGWIQHQSRI